MTALGDAQQQRGGIVRLLESRKSVAAFIAGRVAAERAVVGDVDGAVIHENRAAVVARRVGRQCAAADVHRAVAAENRAAKDGPAWPVPIMIASK